MLRRIAALVLTLLVLHLNLAGARDTCVRHDATDGSASAAGKSLATMHEHAVSHGSPAHVHTIAAAHHGSSAVHSVPGAHDTPPCEVPAQSTCCTALASCNVLFDTDARCDAQMSLSASLVAYGVMHTPLSEIVSPDPPPPRA